MMIATKAHREQAKAALQTLFRQLENYDEVVAKQNAEYPNSPPLSDWEIAVGIADTIRDIMAVESFLDSEISG